MGTIARLSHVAFNVPRDLFDAERDFWENVIGLQFSHRQEGRTAFFAADPFRDHEFILNAVDGPVASYGESGCMLGHVAFDVATAAEVDAFTARLHERGLSSEDHDRGRRRSTFTSPAGIHFEINTPPYANPRGRDDAAVGARNQEA